MNLKGKKIAITGGTGCIGGLLVEFVAQKGATPVIISRSPAPNSKWQYNNLIKAKETGTPYYIDKNGIVVTPKEKEKL